MRSDKVPAHLGAPGNASILQGPAHPPNIRQVRRGQGGTPSRILSSGGRHDPSAGGVSGGNSQEVRDTGESLLLGSVANGSFQYVVSRSSDLHPSHPECVTKAHLGTPSGAPPGICHPQLHPEGVRHVLSAPAVAREPWEVQGSP